jgi:hypothetical protein
VKRLLAVFAGGIGLGAWFRRRRRRAAVPEASQAEELRSKLAETRTAEATEPEPPEDDLKSRRSEVHERARRSLDELG